VWLFLPFFTLVIAIPALFLTPGPVWLSLPLGLHLSQTGLVVALFLLLRVGTSVSLGILLVLTTPWNRLLKALGVLRVPDVAVLILGMTTRYIYLLVHITGELFLSRRSRILGPQGGQAERRMLAATTATLLDKSLQTSGEVYLAMQARGFVSYPRTLDTFRMKRLDWICGAGAVLVSAVAIWLGR
jgi:cobalt ECF transporter T component CbiQ